jgi:uncharacterized protein YbbK (DUF523 family)
MIKKNKKPELQQKSSKDITVFMEQTSKQKLMHAKDANLLPVIVADNSV